MQHGDEVVGDAQNAGVARHGSDLSKQQFMEYLKDDTGGHMAPGLVPQFIRYGFVDCVLMQNS